MATDAPHPRIHTATSGSHPDDIGDEPYQIYRRFGGRVMVAVCEDRVKGIEQMRRLDPGLQMIVLDDAFQHRYVRPTAAIVLSEYSRPPFQDKLMPLGRLREPMRALNRADAVVVTKCPDTAQPIDFRMMREHLELFPYQKLIFSRYAYRTIRPVFPDAVTEIPDVDSYGPSDVIVCRSRGCQPSSIPTPPAPQRRKSESATFRRPPPLHRIRHAAAATEI